MNASHSRRLATTALVLVAATGIGIAVTQSTGAGPVVGAAPPPTAVEVAALVDGDTFDVRVDDVITRVRLAYVRTPPRTRPDQTPACLAADATARLATIIPAGTRLTLTYDKDRTGLPSAEARTDDGRLVNAEIVRAGYANVVRTGLDSPIPPAIDQAVGDAAQEAAANQRGMHSADIACTVPGQVKALAQTVATIPTPPGPTPTALDLSNAAGRATVARMAAEELKSTFAQHRQDISWLTLGPQERTQLEAQVQDACDHAATVETLLRDATSVTVNHDVTLASTQRDAARIAKVMADLRKAEADALAETRARSEAAKAREEKARREQERSDDSDSRGDSNSRRESDSRDSDSRDSNSRDSN